MRFGSAVSRGDYGKRTPEQQSIGSYVYATLGCAVATHGLAYAQELSRMAELGLENHQRGRWFINVGRFIWVRRRHAGRKAGRSIAVVEFSQSPLAGERMIRRSSRRPYTLQV